MTYNVTNYGGGRVNDLQTAMYGTFEGRSARPDLFVGQEFLSSSGLAAFVSLLNLAPGSPGTYAAASFVDGPDTDSVCIYRTDKLVFDAQTIVVTGGTTPRPPRNVIRYDLHPVGYQSTAKFSIYSVHMKAGTTSDDMARRLTETQEIRDNAQAIGRPFMIAGDFNIQTSTEGAYQELTGSQTNNLGRFFDPIKSPGSWNNANQFRFIHTQDPATGFAGMDDRYDFILMSQDLIDASGFDYIGNPNVAYSTTTWNDPNHSYRAWGNDGTSLNQPLKVTGNTMVGATIAQALINSTGGQSGHIPVFLDLRVPGKVGVPTDINLGFAKPRKPLQGVFTVSNLADVSKWSVNGIAALKYSMTSTSGFTVPGGQFSVNAGAVNSHTVTVDTSTPGVKSGTITVTSNDPDLPIVSIPVTAYVLPRLLPHS